MTFDDRAWKTGLAVGITIWLTRMLHVENPIFAMIGAVVSIQPTLTKSLKEGAHRFTGTAIGAVVGLLMNYFRAGNPVLGGLGVVITIEICRWLKMEGPVVIASVVTLAIIFYKGPDTVYYALERVFDTLLGVLVATGVNFLALPGKEFKQEE